MSAVAVGPICPTSIAQALITDATTVADAIVVLDALIAAVPLGGDNEAAYMYDVRALLVNYPSVFVLPYNEGAWIMPSYNLGLPDYVNNVWAEYGFSEAKRRVQVQLVGADTVDAYNYYSGLMLALNAIGSETVPAVSAFGAPAGECYAYAATALPELRASGAISDAAYGRDVLLPVRAIGVMSNP